MVYTLSLYLRESLVELITERNRRIDAAAAEKERLVEEVGRPTSFLSAWHLFLTLDPFGSGPGGTKSRHQSHAPVVPCLEGEV